MAKQEINLLSLTENGSSEDDNTMEDGVLDDILTLIQNEHNSNTEEDYGTVQSIPYSKQELKTAAKMLNHGYLLDIYYHYYNQIDAAALLAGDYDGAGGKDIDIEFSEGLEDVDTTSSDSEQDTTELQAISKVLGTLESQEMQKSGKDAQLTDESSEEKHLHSELNDITRTQEEVTQMDVLNPFVDQANTSINSNGPIVSDLLDHKLLKAMPPSVMCFMYKELKSYIKTALSTLDLVLNEKYEMKRKRLPRTKSAHVSEDEIKIVLSLMPTHNKLV